MHHFLLQDSAKKRYTQRIQVLLFACLALKTVFALLVLKKNPFHIWDREKKSLVVKIFLSRQKKVKKSQPDQKKVDCYDYCCVAPSAKKAFFSFVFLFPFEKRPPAGMPRNSFIGTLKIPQPGIKRDETRLLAPGRPHRF